MPNVDFRRNKKRHPCRHGCRRSLKAMESSKNTQPSHRHHAGCRPTIQQKCRPASMSPGDIAQSSRATRSKPCQLFDHEFHVFFVFFSFRGQRISFTTPRIKSILATKPTISPYTFSCTYSCSTRYILKKSAPYRVYFVAKIEISARN